MFMSSFFSSSLFSSSAVLLAVELLMVLCAVYVLNPGVATSLNAPTPYRFKDKRFKNRRLKRSLRKQQHPFFAQKTAQAIWAERLYRLYKTVSMLIARSGSAIAVKGTMTTYISFLIVISFVINFLFSGVKTMSAIKSMLSFSKKMSVDQRMVFLPKASLASQKVVRR